jgi:hypothetical protein
MSVKTEGTHPGGFILSEANGTLSRDNGTIRVAANSTLEAGAVVGQITASGKYVEYDDANSDGSEEAAGVLYAPITNDTDAAADYAGVVINKDAEVATDELVWKDSVDESGGTADLLALGIKAR